MTGDYYKVSWEAQRTAAGGVGSAVSELAQKLADINASMNRMIGADGWNADSTELYRERQRKWDRALEEIKSICERFQAGLNASADISSGAERANCSIFS